MGQLFRNTYKAPTNFKIYRQDCKMMRRKLILAVFDFDHTIVEENSDIVVRKLIPTDKIPEDVRKLHGAKGWIDYMAEIFKLLHKNKITRQQIIKSMEGLTPTSDMPELLNWLRSSGHETIIISDSNSVFIDTWLQHRCLKECVKEVFTNPACFDQSGLLTIQPYHRQDWCDLSSKNLCKGQILESYIKQRREEGVCFDMVTYTGDGQNDYCPTLKLCASDFVFPRAGFTLENILNNREQMSKVLAKIYPWTSALEIRNILQNL